MDIFDEKRKPQYMQALTAESTRAIDAIFTNCVQGEAQRRKEKSVSSSARTMPGSNLDSNLNSAA